MKRFAILGIFAAAAFAFFACASEDRDRAGAPSGRIVIYTSIYPDIIDTLGWALNQRFPNVTVEFVYGGTGQLQARIASEITRGRLGSDLILVASPSFAHELKGQGVLHPFFPEAAANLAFDFDSEGFWYPVRISNMVLAFDPDRHSRNDLPDSFYGFANDPRLYGVISMSNPLTSGTSRAAITALRDRYGYEFFSSLARQNVSIEAGVLALERLQSGERAMVMVLEESVLRKQEEESSRLEIIYPSDGTVIIPSPIMIVAGGWSANNNTRTAEIIADWFLGEEGQRAIVSGWMHSVIKDFRYSPFGSIPLNQIIENSMPFHWENVLSDGNYILERFEDLALSPREGRY